MQHDMKQNIMLNWQHETMFSLFLIQLQDMLDIDEPRIVCKDI